MRCLLKTRAWFFVFFAIPSHADKTQDNCFQILTEIFHLPTRQPLPHFPESFEIGFPKDLDDLFDDRTEARLNLTTQGEISHSLRIELKPGKIAHEVWASNFLTDFGNVSVPQHRFLTNHEIKIFLGQLKRQNPLAYYLMHLELARWRGIDAASVIEIVPERISISSWVANSKTGKDSLPTELDKLKGEDSTFRFQVRQIINEAHPGLIKKLDTGLVLASILGIWDFHRANWLLDTANTPWMIDFTSSDLVSECRHLCDELFQLLTFHPYYWGAGLEEIWESEEILAEAALSLSPSTLASLKRLTKQKLIKHALDYGYVLDPKDAEKMRKRIQFILKAAKKSRANVESSPNP